MSPGLRVGALFGESMKVELINKLGQKIKVNKRDARILTMIGKATVVEKVKPDPVPAVLKAPEPQAVETAPVKRAYRRRNMTAEPAQTYNTRAIKDDPQE